MTIQELMALADKYARAYAYWYANPANERRDLELSVKQNRTALEEAMTLTSQFGGL